MYTVQTLQLYENITHVHLDIKTLGKYHSCTLGQTLDQLH